MQRRTRTRAALLIWTTGIVAVSLVPSGGVSVWNVDKLGHFIAYAGLAILVHMSFDSARARIALCLAAVALGASLELAQQFVPGRDMSLVDGLVNAAGVLAGSLGYLREASKSSRAE